MAPGLINDGNIIDEPDSPQQYTDHEETRGTSAVFNRSLNHDPLLVVSSKGNSLELSNGQRIFDATGGAAVSCIGHGNERVRQALMSQMGEVGYCHSLFYGTRAAEDLARLLIDTTCGEMARAFIISSGSEAMEAAIKLARQYHLEKATPEPERIHFIARQQSYHGTTLGALAVGGHVTRRALYEPIMSVNSSRVSPCYVYRGAAATTHEKAYARKLEAELDAEFQRVGPRRVAAFIAEPVVGAALGCVPAVNGYFQAVRKICDKYGALLILDEVMCGIGRVGPEPTARYPKPLHAWQDPLIGVVPDIMTMGKGLGGGYVPVAAVLANHKIVDALKAGTGAFSHGQTYQGHPLACRAALEVQRIIAEADLVQNVRTQGALLGKLLHEKLGKHPAVGDIRGKGLFWGIEFVTTKATKEPFDAREGVASGIHELGLQPHFNISLYPGSGCVDGYRGDHIILAPAYNVTASEVRHIVETTAQVIQEFFRKYQDQLMSTDKRPC
ncbi:class III aminotransferase like protein [Teratosphaeria destructans]|uniref:Class III aminotransferase like protein n=1 Tax=Teratosphaeria destructans TaxID=418781 RepID=A0A9W7SLB8_9PEZI|nr:class III aminotransferase like protein [Teratosphaeria destructans]